MPKDIAAAPSDLPSIEEVDDAGFSMPTAPPKGVPCVGEDVEGDWTLIEGSHIPPALPGVHPAIPLVAGTRLNPRVLIRHADLPAADIKKPPVVARTSSADIKKMLGDAEFRSYQVALLTGVPASKDVTSPAHNFKIAINSAKTIKNIGDAFRNIIEQASKQMDPKQAADIKDLISQSETLGSLLGKIKQKFPDVALLKNVIEIADNFFNLMPNAKGITFTGGAYSQTIVVGEHDRCGQGIGPSAPAVTTTKVSSASSANDLVTTVMAGEYVHVLAPRAKSPAVVSAAAPAQPSQQPSNEHEDPFALFTNEDDPQPVPSIFKNI